MLVYYIIGLLFLLLSILYYLEIIPDSSLLIVFILFILSFFIVGCRYEIGADWSNYCDFYYSGYAADKTSGTLEPIFTLIRFVCYNLGLSHVFFFAFISFFSLYLIYPASKMLGVNNVYLVYLVYFCLFFLNYQFNIIRHGALASCIMLSYAYRSVENNQKAVLWAAIGSGFHIVGILFLLLMFFIDIELSRLKAFTIIIISFVFYYLGIGERLLSYFPMLENMDRLAGYFDTNRWESYGLSIGLVFNVGIILYFFIFRFGEYYESRSTRIMVNCLLIGVVCSLTLNVFGAIVSRVSNLMNVSLVFIWPLLLQGIYYKTNRCIMCVLISIYFIMYFGKALAKDEMTGESVMYPYKMRIEQVIRY